MGEHIQINGDTAYRAAAGTGGPGVLVLHAWWGLNGFFTDLCDRLAAEGFAALAPDLYGGPTAATVEEAQALLDGRDDLAMDQRASAAIDALRADPALPLARSASRWAGPGRSNFASARPADLGACVIFYGNGEADFSAARAAYLGHFAVDDPWEPDEYVKMTEQAMRAAGREVLFHHYTGVGH